MTPGTEAPVSSHCSTWCTSACRPSTMQPTSHRPSRRTAAPTLRVFARRPQFSDVRFPPASATPELRRVQRGGSLSEVASFRGNAVAGIVDGRSSNMKPCHGSKYRCGQLADCRCSHWIAFREYGRALRRSAQRPRWADEHVAVLEDNSSLRSARPPVRGNASPGSVPQDPVPKLLIASTPDEAEVILWSAFESRVNHPLASDDCGSLSRHAV